MTNEEAINVLREQESAYWYTLTEAEHKAFDLAVDALTAQQPHVLTLEEALGLDEDLCWIEINVDGADRNFGRWNDLYLYPDGISIVSEWAGQKNYLDSERYGKTWRCWNTRPTDEQRKATPWD